MQRVLERKRVSPDAVDAAAGETLVDDVAAQADNGRPRASTLRHEQIPIEV
jgi:hypothetical protein